MKKYKAKNHTGAVKVFDADGKRVAVDLSVNESGHTIARDTAGWFYLSKYGSKFTVLKNQQLYRLKI